MCVRKSGGHAACRCPSPRMPPPPPRGHSWVPPPPKDRAGCLSGTHLQDPFMLPQTPWPWVAGWEDPGSGKASSSSMKATPHNMLSSWYRETQQHHQYSCQWLD